MANAERRKELEVTMAAALSYSELLDGDMRSE
jgi:hypothetical protein